MMTTQQPCHRRHFITL